MSVLRRAFVRTVIDGRSWFSLPFVVTIPPLLIIGMVDSGRRAVFNIGFLTLSLFFVTACRELLDEFRAHRDAQQQ